MDRHLNDVPEPDGAAGELAPPSECVSVERLLLDVCRSRVRDRDVGEVVVDCSPPGLGIAPADGRRLGRCAARLLDALLARPNVSELVVAARAEDDPVSPTVVISARALRRTQDGGNPAVGDDDSEATARRVAKREGGTLLGISRASGERRLALALDMRAVVARPPDRRPPPRERVLVADDHPRARRVARRLLEASGFEVSEASGVVPLLARLDPDETNGPPPDWLLVDESWFASAAHRRFGLAAALTAALPRDRILLVGGPNVRRATPLLGWRRIVKPFGWSELQGALAVESGGASWRNAEAEIPYSLSL